MKHFLCITSILVSSLMFAQAKADDLIGTYMTDKSEGMVEITKKDSKYYGKLTWTKTAGKLDENNPDKAKRTEKLAGKEILKDFTYDDGTWEDGTIYDPKNGKTYSCKITRDEKGNLNVRGFVGVSMLGRTTFWVKVK